MIQFLITQTNYRVGWPIGSERLRWKASRCNLGENRRFANGDYQTFADEFFFSVMCGQVCSRGSQERMFFLFSDILLYAKKSGSLDKDQRYERTRVLAYNLFVKRFFAPATKRTKKDSRKTIFSNSLLVVI